MDKFVETESKIEVIRAGEGAEERLLLNGYTVSVQGDAKLCKWIVVREEFAHSTEQVPILMPSGVEGMCSDFPRTHI